MGEELAFNTKPLESDTKALEGEAHTTPWRHIAIEREREEPGRAITCAVASRLPSPRRAFLSLRCIHTTVRMHRTTPASILGFQIYGYWKIRIGQFRVFLKDSQGVEHERLRIFRSVEWRSGRHILLDLSSR